MTGKEWSDIYKANLERVDEAMSDDADSAYAAMANDYQIARGEIERLHGIVAELQARPNILPCECSHHWGFHIYEYERGGCSECDCELMVAVVKIGQSHSCIIEIP